MDKLRTPWWQQAIWIGSGLSLLITILVLLGFSIHSISRVVGLIESRPDSDLAFVFSSMGVVTLTLLRLLAILIGAAIAFAGLAVSFFSHEHALSATADMNVSSSTNIKAGLVAYAPGLVGLIVGALVIVSALYVKSKHDYKGPETYSVVGPGTSASKATPNSDQSTSGLRSLDDVLKQPSTDSSQSK